MQQSYAIYGSNNLSEKTVLKIQAACGRYTSSPVLFSGLQLRTSVTVTNWTFLLPRCLVKKVWTSFTRSEPPSLPSMTVWSISLNWSVKVSQFHTAHIKAIFHFCRLDSEHALHLPGPLLWGGEQRSWTPGRRGQREVKRSTRLRHQPLHCDSVYLQSGCGGDKAAQGEGRSCCFSCCCSLWLQHFSLCDASQCGAAFCNFHPCASWPSTVSR